MISWILTMVYQRDNKIRLQKGSINNELLLGRVFQCLSETVAIGIDDKHYQCHSPKYHKNKRFTAFNFTSRLILLNILSHKVVNFYIKVFSTWVRSSQT